MSLFVGAKLETNTVDLASFGKCFHATVRS